MHTLFQSVTLIINKSIEAYDDDDDDDDDSRFLELRGFRDI